MTKTVLIVDDNAFIRQALREIFDREGDFIVCGEADNGRDAIDAVTRLQPDLVVLDFSMPVMNGLDAAKILRARTPTLPVILYSAVTDRTIAVLARSMGISELVSKSEPVSVLIRRARHLLFQAAA
jgi:two-component system, chemotaxis family, chemotaxis protein CheY